MKSLKQSQEELKIELDNNHIIFDNFEDIYFPKNCVVCGKPTQRRINKNLYGIFSSNYAYKKNYYFSIPLCDECEDRLNIKSGLRAKSGKILLATTIIGFLISILLFLLTVSIFLSIGIVLLSFILPFRYYKEQTKAKIKFDNYLKLYISKNDPNSVELDFNDEIYAKSLREINFAKLKEKEAKEKEVNETIENDKEGEADGK